MFLDLLQVVGSGVSVAPYVGVETGVVALKQFGVALDPLTEHFISKSIYYHIYIPFL